MSDHKQKPGVAPLDSDDEEDLPTGVRKIREVLAANGGGRGSISSLEAGFLVMGQEQAEREQERRRKEFRKTLLGILGATLVIGGAVFGFGRVLGTTEEASKNAASEAVRTSKQVEKVVDVLTKHDRILGKIEGRLGGVEKTVDRLGTGVEKNRGATEELRLGVEKLRQEMQWRRHRR